jgi:hypothetical protein
MVLSELLLLPRKLISRLLHTIASSSAQMMRRSEGNRRHPRRSVLGRGPAVHRQRRTGPKGSTERAPAQQFVGLALPKGRLDACQEIVGGVGFLDAPATQYLAQNVAEATTARGLVASEDTPQNIAKVSARRALPR